MSVRLDMQRAATLGAQFLGESLPPVKRFLASRLNSDGGFADRAGRSDLYYTVFGVQAMRAAGMTPLPHCVADFVRKQAGRLDELDLVHAACLARLRAELDGDAMASVPAEHIARSIEHFRTADGGYGAASGSPSGSVYAAFLAVAAYQDLQLAMPQPERLAQSLSKLRRPDGGYANDTAVPVSLTTATAAAAVTLHELGAPPDPSLADWLLARCDAEGGFFASTLAPLPDLLSTATALHALSSLRADIRGIREACLDFLDTLWSSQGAFHGSWADDALDCEYTFYGLLALGHLADGL